jgi:hypothetical protein
MARSVPSTLPAPAEWRHCSGCGAPVEECPGCSGAYEPWRFCVDCGRWLTVQVTPTGWRARCRGCGGALEAAHGAAG